MSAPQGVSPPVASSQSQPNASSQELLYATAAAGNAVYVFSYPGGSLVDKIVPPHGTISMQGLCSDKAGEVYVTTMTFDGRSSAGHVLVYQHGGKSPILHYDFNGVEPMGCSVDSNYTLAVTTVGLGASSGFLETIPTTSSGESQIYYDYNISNYYYCGYDSKGNLFVEGQGAGPSLYLAELHKGAKSLTNLALSKSISDSGMGQVQSDGTNITIEDVTASEILRLRVSGYKAVVTGTTRLTYWNYPTLSWIQSGTVIVPTGTEFTNIGFWKYPAGGKPTKTIKAPASVYSVTVSVGTRV